MATVAIIGSAGRKHDRVKVSRKIFTSAYDLLTKRLEDWQPDLTLVSGGAAFIDHLAVQLYLNGECNHLILHLPAPFSNSKFQGKNWNSPGQVANHYHSLFSRKTNIPSLLELQRAIDQGAETYVYNGFKSRNLEVGRVDCIQALTFGRFHSRCYPGTSGWTDSVAAGLKPGGTSHTWNNSSATLKEHTNLHQLPE